MSGPPNATDILSLKLSVKCFNTIVREDKLDLINSNESSDICFTPLLIVWIGINLLTFTYWYVTPIPVVFTTRYITPWTSSIIWIICRSPTIIMFFCVVFWCVFPVSTWISISCSANVSLILWIC